MLRIQTTKGTLFVLASSVMFSVMACLIKTISEINPFLTTYMRFVIGLLILSVLALSGRVHFRFTHWRLLFLRGIVGSIGVCITYIVIVKIGVSKSTVILYSYPVLASLLGAYALKERMHWSHFVALGVAMIGLYLLVTKSNGLKGFTQIGPYELLAMLGSVIYAITVVVIRKLHETETSYEIFFAQCAFGAAILLLPANIGTTSIGWMEIGILLAIGILATSGQLTMTQGFRYLTVKIASLLSMSQLIFNYAAGILIFDESLTTRAFVGSALIAAACLIALLGQEKA